MTDDAPDGTIPVTALFDVPDGMVRAGDEIHDPANWDRCPRCGTDCPADATGCWRCGARFGPRDRPDG